MSRSAPESERGLPGAVAQSHLLASAVVGEGDLAVDATAGNGQDTLALARRVGAAGKVLAVDLQAAAIEATRNRLLGAGLVGRVLLRLGDHRFLGEYLAEAGWPVGSVAAVMFNLGYLPRGDKTLITRPHTSVEALRAAADWLRPGGLITVVCYTGHPGGSEEGDAVEAWAAGLPQSEWTSSRYGMLNQRGSPPHLVAVMRHRLP